MRKASSPSGGKKRTQKRAAPKQPAKAANAQKAQGGAGLAAVVTQLAKSTEKLAQAADRLAEASERLSGVAKERHESLDTHSQSTADAATSRQESDPADETR
jgi:hypothetical protein